MRLRVFALLCFLSIASVASAQTQIPPPAGPLTFCVTQSPPPADSYQLVFDGGAPEAVTLTAGTVAGCGAGTTHTFQLPANRFPVGQHTAALIASNAFGSSTGPVFTVTVGVAPGPATITGVVQGS